MLNDTSILVTEDEDALRELYTMWLTNAGASVTEATNGDEALEAWDDSYDLVMLDRRMPPGMSGGDVLAEARQNGLTTPVMMLTAVEPEMDVLDMGFDDYLTKPVDQDNLLSIVRDLVQATEIRDEVREFASLGVKIHQLQKNHTADALRMHTEFQSIKRRYNELLETLSVAENEFTDYEKHFLLLARERLDESDLESENSDPEAPADSASQSAD